MSVLLRSHAPLGAGADCARNTLYAVKSFDAVRALSFVAPLVAWGSGRRGKRAPNGWVRPGERELRSTAGTRRRPGCEPMVCRGHR